MCTSTRYKPENRCTRCNTDVTSMNRSQQDKHEIDCKNQSKLFES